jgi:hypothetical protein
VQALPGRRDADLPVCAWPPTVAALQSLYTGVYANGGPTNVDGNRSLSGLCDRSSADVRGVKKAGVF